jgi:RNA polymerase sigma-70 factor (ECF subfamily)
MGLSIDPAVWVDEYGDYLFRYALSYVRDKQVAEDLVQETFVAALQFHDTFCGRSSEKTWLIGILKHKAIDYYRRNRMNNQLSDLEDVRAGISRGFLQGGKWANYWNTVLSPKDWRMDPSQSSEQNEFWTILEACLSKLPPRMARAFQLREVEQLGTKEICEILSISEANLWVMLHRSRLHLRQCFELMWTSGIKKAA